MTEIRESYLNKNVASEAPDLSKITDDFTSAVIERPIGELGGLNWQIGLQICDKERKPYSREFNELRFPPSETSLEKIELGAYNEQYEGDFYYSVVTEFKEDVYRSTRDLRDRTKDFIKWQKEEITYRHEKINVHKKVHEIVWERPKFKATVGGTSNSSNDNGDNSGGSSSRGAGQGQEIEIYVDLPKEFIIGTANSNKGLAAEVICSHPIEIKVKSSAQAEEGEIVTGLFLLRKRYIEIKLKNVVNGKVGVGSHPEVKINFYGKYKYQVFYPKDIQKSPTYLLHRDSTPEISRLQPPGKNFPDNFWNSNPPPPSIEEYSSRVGQDPNWEELTPIVRTSTQQIPGIND